MGKKVQQSVNTRLRNMVKSNPQAVKISESEIIVPTDEQAQLKQQIISNTTPLGISATYTGASFDTMAEGVNYTWLTGMVTANQSGNIQIQQSADGTNWRLLDSFAVTASTPAKISVDILARYIRIVFINGATAQTSFELVAYTTFK